MPTRRSSISVTRLTPLPDRLRGSASHALQLGEDGIESFIRPRQPLGHRPDMFGGLACCRIQQRQFFFGYTGEIGIDSMTDLLRYLRPLRFCPPLERFPLLGRDIDHHTLHRGHGMLSF